MADKRVDFTYLKDGRFNSITRYADLSGTDLVATTDYGYDANGRIISLVHSEARRSWRATSTSSTPRRE